MKWDQFVQLNCIVYLQCAKFEDSVDFFCRVLDPKDHKFVPEKELNDTMNVFFGGAF